MIKSSFVKWIANKIVDCLRKKKNAKQNLPKKLFRTIGENNRSKTTLVEWT